MGVCSVQAVTAAACILALLSGTALAQATQQMREQNGRSSKHANEPVQHKEWRKRVSGRTLKGSGAGVSSYTTELAPGVADVDASSAALVSAAPMLASMAPAPAPYTQPGSAEGELPDAALDSASAEDSAAQAPGPIPYEIAAQALEAARNETNGTSPCDTLKGSPAEWMRSGGALGFACAQQHAMAVNGSQGSSWDPHTAFKIVASQHAPPSLQTMLRLRLAAQQQMGAGSLTAASDVRSFMSAATNVNPRDTAGQIRAISASAIGAVNQATNDADNWVFYTPDGPDKKLIGSDFTSFFLAAVDNPKLNGMRLKKGKYTVNAGANPVSHLWILCNPDIPRKTPFVLDLGGSELIFEDRTKTGFFITDCVNVEIRGPVRAYHTPGDMPFTQGTIKEINNDKSLGYNWIVESHDGFPADFAVSPDREGRGFLIRFLIPLDPEIHNGFPADSVVGPDGKGKGFLMRFDPKSLLMPDDYYDATFLSHTKLSSSPPTYRFVFDVAQPAGKVGDYVALRGTGSHGIMMKGCTNTTVGGITMHNVGMFFLIDWTGNGNTYSNNTLVPWPEQVGNGKVPTLLAGNADGIHSLGASLGPKVIGNTIANIGDDAIAIHGLFFVVAKTQKDSKSVTIATPDLRGSIQAGSTIVAYSGDQLNILGSANVKSIKQVGNPLLPGVSSKMLPGYDFKNQLYYEVTLEGWPEGFNNLTFDNFIANPGHTGSGFELRDNTIMNNRGRGMLVKAGNGVVEGNTVIRPTFWPLQVMPEYYWMEADWSQNVRIANNYIEGPYGGILVGLIRLYEQGSGQYMNHRNITILNNILANNNYAPIIVTSAVNVTVGNNTIQDALCDLPSIGQGYRWLDGSSLIFADNVKGLKLDPPNRIVNNAGCTHGNYWRPISLGKNATDVTFTEGRDYMS